MNPSTVDKKAEERWKSKDGFSRPDIFIDNDARRNIDDWGRQSGDKQRHLVLPLSYFCLESLTVSIRISILLRSQLFSNSIQFHAPSFFCCFLYSRTGWLFDDLSYFHLCFPNILQEFRGDQWCFVFQFGYVVSLFFQINKWKLKYKKSAPFSIFINFYYFVFSSSEGKLSTSRSLSFAVVAQWQHKEQDILICTLFLILNCHDTGRADFYPFLRIFGIYFLLKCLYYSSETFGNKMLPFYQECVSIESAEAGLITWMIGMAELSIVNCR